MKKHRMIIPKYYYWLFFWYIIGNIIQILVFVHSELGGARKYDGFYAPLPIMAIESMLWMISGTYNLFILILTLVRFKYNLLHIPLTNTIGFLLILITFIISGLSYNFYLTFIAQFDFLVVYLHFSLKLISIYFAFKLLKKLK